MKIDLKFKKIISVLTFVDFLALVFIAWVYPEIKAGTYALSLILVLGLAALVWINQAELKLAAKSRNARYGFNSFITTALVVAILVVLNFVNFKHYYKKDFTGNQSHSLSEQTIKILKELKKDVQLTAFVKAQQKDAVKALFANYAYYSDKLKLDYVDIDRDPIRAKAANIKESTASTIVVKSDTKETRITDTTEEKLTNALIQVLKDRKAKVCFLQGHGEKDPNSQEADGYSQVKKDLESQSFQTKNFNLLEETKVPQDCDVILVLGPKKAFFDKEIPILAEYLEKGGRALFALDPNIQGKDASSNKEIKELLAKWQIEFDQNLVIDPTSRLLGANASVPMAGVYNKEHVITKDFEVSALFPITSTLTIKSGGTLKTWWIARTTPKAFIKTDFKEIATGQVKLDPAKDKMGSFDLMAAVEGNKTRLIVIGTSGLGINAYSRHGAGLDLFLNSISWLANEESLISIRPKEEQLQAPSLTETEGRFVQLLTMGMLPGTILMLGTGVWFRRRKL